MKFSVSAESTHDAVAFAVEELRRCLALYAGPLEPAAETVHLVVVAPANQEVDEYTIDVDLAASRGSITGSNPRAVLFGAYRLLAEIGFRWVRPGIPGEVVPPAPAMLPHIRLSSRASYRHRGICIEGAASRENVLELIHWMVKLGFNGYYIQFRDGYTFFARWYLHRDNKEIPPEPFSVEHAVEITRDVRSELRKLDLDIHMVGHGWTCEPYGIPGNDWYEHKEPIAPEIKRHFAMINGKRELFTDIILRTNLCYSSPEVRETLTASVRDWAVANPDVNIIHFWLADSSKNFCECTNCAAKRPADWYVDLLNEIDRKLTAAEVNTKIVFLLYHDLLWPPERSRIEHPERFILMFAPITRTFTTPFVPDDSALTDDEPLLPYVLNKEDAPSNPAKNLAFLRAWQRIFSGSSFDYDYHFMWDHHKDAGFYTMAQILHRDCQDLRKIGLDGLMSCQNQRTFYPNALGMTVMGRTLWNRELGFEEIASDFFRSAYGEADAEAARNYFHTVSQIFHPELLRGEGTKADRRAAAAGLPAYEEAVKRVSSALERGRCLLAPAQRESWEELLLHIEETRLLAKVLLASWSGEGDVDAALETLYEWARRHEMRLQPWFDFNKFLCTFDKMRRLEKVL